MNLKLRIAILSAGYRTQSDFSSAVKMSMPFVSNVLCDRKKLSKAQAAIWLTVLKCRPILLKKVTTTN